MACKGEKGGIKDMTCKGEKGGIKDMACKGEKGGIKDMTCKGEKGGIKDMACKGEKMTALFHSWVAFMFQITNIVGLVYDFLIGICNVSKTDCK